MSLVWIAWVLSDDGTPKLILLSKHLLYHEHRVSVISFKPPKNSLRLPCYYLYWIDKKLRNGAVNKCVQGFLARVCPSHLSNPGPPNSKAHTYYNCAPVPSPRCYREETDEKVRIDKLLKVERKERGESMANPEQDDEPSRESERSRWRQRENRQESLSQKPKLEKISI